jgi:hypothetical protein
MVGRINKGPTPTAGKARPIFFPLKNSSSAPHRRTTSDPSSHPGYLDKRLCLA